MYDKVEKEVRENFIRQYTIKDNDMRWVVIQSYSDFLNDREDIQVRFTLNWKEFNFRRDWQHFERMKTDMEMFEIFAEYFQWCVM